MLAAMKQVDPIAPVDADAGNIAESPAIRKPGPIVHDSVAVLAAAEGCVHTLPSKCTLTEPKPAKVATTVCPGFAQLRPVYVPMVTICPTRTPVLPRWSFTSAAARKRGPLGGEPPGGC